MPEKIKNLTNLENQFKKFRMHLSKDEDLTQNLFQGLRLQYKDKKLDYYDFIDQMQTYNKLLYQYAEYLTDTGISNIEISDNNVIFTTRKENIRMVFNGRDRRGVPFDMINWGSYETTETKIFDHLLSDGMLILDIGSNIGWYSLLWGKKFPHAKIHAFEPIAETYNYLVTNVRLNGLTNVEMHNFGLSDEEGDRKFYYYPGGACLASEKNVIGYEQAKEITCQIKTLDSIENFWGTKTIDLIKCDVEGSELFMLKGSVSTIQRHRPIIALELINEWAGAFNYHPDDVIVFLRQFGYNAFLPEGEGLKEVSHHIVSDYDRQNYFFLHCEKHKELIKKHSP